MSIDRVYVETNFVIELVLEQEEHASCEEILSLCERGQLRLLLPAFSLFESRHTVKGKKAHGKSPSPHAIHSLHINRNTNDFGNPQIINELSQHSCDLEGSFKKGLERIKMPQL